MPGWRMFEEDPDVQATYWELDQTGGAVHENERNALLCQDSKEMMYDWHKNWGCAHASSSESKAFAV